jgi:hypothetical protein
MCWWQCKVSLMHGKNDVSMDTHAWSLKTSVHTELSVLNHPETVIYIQTVKESVWSRHSCLYTGYISCMDRDPT